ncbi:hypothetical protein M3M39_03725 [Fructilactobacillus hinvesii]|uniref:Competence protein n=1 Tax=Fructilactobacillus hinvesii TaxID=2940300 RepID=A0ABY5BQI8_9LACO|nr:competence protein CoiA family protein [Fructilactobacillus hinvesii]USS87240.1 hypothetical protein M3M39_03725 [Fructilactobacillus hinvesii]
MNVVFFRTFFKGDFLLIAMTTTQKRIKALRAQRKQHYFCPNCHEQVQLRRGAHKIAHFAHQPNSDCHIGEPETTEHLAGKLFLEQQWQTTSKAQLEVYLPAIKQRPDVLVDQKLVLEFQCSPLTVKRLSERVSGYQRVGLHSEWLLGQAYYQRRKTAASVLQFLAYRPSIGYYLLFLNVRESKLRLRYHLSFTDQCLDFQERLFFTWKTLSEFWRQMQLVDAPIASLLGIQSWLIQQLRWRNPATLTLQEECYRCHHLLQGCPLVCHYPRRVPPLNTALWWLTWRIQVVLELETNHLVSLPALINRLEQQLQYPLLPNLRHQVAWLVTTFMRELRKQGAGQECRDQLEWIKDGEWFVDERQKLAAIIAKEKD